VLKIMSTFRKPDRSTRRLAFGQPPGSVVDLASSEGARSDTPAGVDASPPVHWIETANGLERSDSAPSPARLFPTPCFAQARPDRGFGDDAVIEIGWADGVLIDGRPFRMELACSNDIVDARFFVSAEGLGDWRRRDWAAFLVEHGLIRFTSTLKFANADETRDERGQPMLLIAVLLEHERTRFAELLIPWRSYEVDSGN
jgi:hypothetical protein